MQRAPRSHFVLALLAILVLAGLGWFQLDGLQVENPLPDLARLPMPAAYSQPPAPPSPPEATPEQSPAVSPAAKSAVEFNLAQTSWENPFQAEYWDAPGWTFSSAGMQPGDVDPVEARFRRPYQHLTLSCGLEQLRDSAGPFEIRLTLPETKQRLTLRVQPGRVTLTDDVDGKSRTLVDRALELPPADQKSSLEGTAKADQHDQPAGKGRKFRLRLVATGNRIVVSRDGRVVAHCDQPAAYSGHALHWSFRAGNALAIRALRVEGE